MRRLSPLRLRILPLLMFALACSGGDDPATKSGSAVDCAALPDHVEKDGTQGVKIWKGETYVAFPQERGERYCVPEGWEPAGYAEAGPGWAIFPPRHTGVFIRTADWSREEVQYADTLFPVLLLWPNDANPKKLAQMKTSIQRAFEDVGAMYPKLPEDRRALHTVIITAGIAGDTRGAKTRVYPEPAVNLTSMFRLPGHHRAESLFIHAVAHLYNRHRPYTLNDQADHWRVPSVDFSELVASWTEHRFGTNVKVRRKRLEYLYNIHTAVQTGDFSLIVVPPFNEEEGFRKIQKTVAVKKGAGNMSVHYGHYIIGCLSMVATEGLLAKSLRDVVLLVIVGLSYSNVLS